jgi:hypothetical protein
MGELINIDGAERLARQLETEDADRDYAISHSTATAAVFAIRWMVAELRDRRAADLSAEDVQALKFAMDVVRSSVLARHSRHDQKCDVSLAVLDRLVKGGTR